MATLRRVRPGRRTAHPGRGTHCGGGNPSLSEGSFRRGRARPRGKIGGGGEKPSPRMGLFVLYARDDSLPHRDPRRGGSAHRPSRRAREDGGNGDSRPLARAVGRNAVFVLALIPPSVVAMASRGEAELKIPESAPEGVFARPRFSRNFAKRSRRRTRRAGARSPVTWSR